MKKFIAFLIGLSLLNIFLQVNLYSQTQRNPVIEFCTGTWCQWCPCGDYTIENLLAAYPNLIPIAYHGPAGSDPFANFPGNGIISLLGFQGYPTATVDRSSSTGDYTTWSSKVQSRVNIPATVSINLEYNYNVSTRHLEGTFYLTSLQNLTGQFYLNVILTEDSLIYNQVNNGVCVGGGTNWVHNWVVRSMINGATGESVNAGSSWNSGETINKPLSYTVPSGFRADKCKISAFVYKNMSPLYLAEIQQAESWPVINNCRADSILLGWNILSLPYLSDQNLKTELFPTAESDAYWFNGTYIICNTLQPKRGYWLKFDNSFLNFSCGQAVEDTIHIKSGWNMIGCLEKDVPVNEIVTDPPGILSSNFWGYSGGYFNVDTLKVTKGYWIKSNQDGILNLNPAYNKSVKNKTKIEQNWGNITITDIDMRKMKLYFTENANYGNYQLPPLPPPGAFDARFASDRLVESLNNGSNMINISGAQFPLKIRASGVDLKVKDLIDGSILNETLNDGNEIIIYDSRINKISLSGEYVNQTPANFNLEQNFPNPFNPTTIIKFSIPKKVLVNLSIYDILGVKVKELKNEVMDPGYYEINFNASDLASGVYFYRIKATPGGGQQGDPSTSSGQVFVQTKKMILLK
jgi:hypothetical protein